MPELFVPPPCRTDGVSWRNHDQDDGLLDSAIVVQSVGRVVDDDRDSLGRRCGSWLVSLLVVETEGARGDLKPVKL